jgi:hypothetical protein
MTLWNFYRFARFNQAEYLRRGRIGFEVLRNYGD